MSSVTGLLTGQDTVAQAVQSGDTITIMGTKTVDDPQLSAAFNLDKGAYITTWKNSGNKNNVDIFIADLSAVNDSTWGSLT